MSSKDRKTAIARPAPTRLPIATVKALMQHLETDAPEWCAKFALCLFAGVREGEIRKLAEGVKSDGVSRYVSGGFLHLPAKMTKDRRARSTEISGNLAAWLAAYPLTPASIRPGDYEHMAPIRDKFSLGHDILRHTAIAAYIAKHGSIADAATQYGTSEKIIRDHYLKPMTAAEAAEYFSIVPNGPEVAVSLSGRS